MNGEVTITMSWSKVLAVCATLLLSAASAVAGIGELWLSSMQTDIREVRADFSAAMGSNNALRDVVNGQSASLIQKINETRIIVAQNSTKLDNLEDAVSRLRAEDRQLMNAIMKNAPGSK